MIIGKVKENSRTSENYIKQQPHIESGDIMRKDENLKRFQKKAFDFSFLEHEQSNKNEEESFKELVHPYHKKSCGTYDSSGAQQIPNYDGNLFQTNFNFF